LASIAPRRARKAKKAVLVVDAIAAAQPAPVAEPEVAPEKPKRVRRAVKKQVVEPTPEPVSAAHAALLAAIEASADGGVVYERAETVRTAEAAPPEEESLRQSRLKLALKALDGLPPIRLPIGPAIPWRFGVPALVALVLVMFLFGRPTAHADTSFKLPAESETYAVTQDSPLFTQSQQPQPIGVAEPAGLNVDVLDLTLKLVAVLALAYGSLLVLKRLGVGGAGTGSVTSTSSEGLRVLSTLALAPNRSIHVVRAPDGKTLLLGATPGQVNLITELGDVPEVAGVGPGSFFDILTSKLQH
jgi:flagellar biogenesis protein FliO